VLREAIVIGLLPGGDAIRMDAVARALDVTTTSVREALRELEGARLIGFMRNRSFVVAPQSSLELQDAFEARLALGDTATAVGTLEAHLAIAAE
jgi:DNA-binding GntR family transcriptional regulator